MDRLRVGMLEDIGALLACDQGGDGDIAAGTSAQLTEIGTAVPPELSELQEVRLYTQATTTMKLLKHERDRGLLQTAHLEDAVSATAEADKRVSA